MKDEAPDDKRERVLTAALRLFNANGFDRTPTSGITRAAGVATGTLFHHFGSKEELINELYLRCKTSLVQSALDGLEADAPYRERFKKLYLNILRWTIDKPEEFFFFRQFNTSPYITAATKAEGRSRFDPIISSLAEGLEAETFKAAPIDYLLDLIAVHLMASAEYFLGHKEAGIDFPELSFDLLWDGLKK